MRIQLEDTGRSVDMEQSWTLYGEPTFLQFLIKALVAMGYTKEQLLKELLNQKGEQDGSK